MLPMPGNCAKPSLLEGVDVRINSGFRSKSFAQICFRSHMRESSVWSAWILIHWSLFNISPPKKGDNAAETQGVTEIENMFVRRKHNKKRVIF